MKESSLSLIERTRLTRDSARSLIEASKLYLDSDPWFFGTLYLVSCYLLECFDEQRKEEIASVNEEVLGPFVDFIESFDMSADERIQRAGHLLKALLVPFPI